MRLRNSVLIATQENTSFDFLLFTSKCYHLMWILVVYDWLGWWQIIRFGRFLCQCWCKLSRERENRRKLQYQQLRKHYCWYRPHGYVRKYARSNASFEFGYEVRFSMYLVTCFFFCKIFDFVKFVRRMKLFIWFGMPETYALRWTYLSTCEKFSGLNPFIM